MVDAHRRQGYARINRGRSVDEVVVPVRAILKDIGFKDRRLEGRIVGTIPWFTETNDYQVAEGRFITDVDMESRRPVCVLGSRIAQELFPLESPIGKLIKLGTYAFRCVGVMHPKTVIRGDDTGALEDYGLDVYTPLTTVRDYFGDLMRRYDVFVCPTLAKPAIRANASLDYASWKQDGKRLPDALAWCMTYPFNMLSRCPVMSVPSGFAKNGVPTGIQIVGRTYEDASVFRAATAFERAMPWAYDRPKHRPQPKKK